MTWNITRISACCPMCHVIYHSLFINWRLDNKASKKICLSAQPSVLLHPKHRPRLNSLCNFQLWFIQSVLLKWENKQPFKKKKKRLGKQENLFCKQEGESEMLFQLLVFNSPQQALNLVVFYGICLLERQIKNWKVNACCCHLVTFQ